MKERIVIEDFVCNDNCKRKDCEVCFKERSKKEQVPETWEDLKELCKGITVGLKICKDGTVYCYEHCIAKNRTPQQMWQIIKGLIGE